MKEDLGVRPCVFTGAVELGRLLQIFHDKSVWFTGWMLGIRDIDSHVWMTYSSAMMASLPVDDDGIIRVDYWDAGGLIRVLCWLLVVDVNGIVWMGCLLVHVYVDGLVKDRLSATTHGHRLSCKDRLLAGAGGCR